MQEKLRYYEQNLVNYRFLLIYNSVMFPGIRLYAEMIIYQILSGEPYFGWGEITPADVHYAMKFIYVKHRD